MLRLPSIALCGWMGSGKTTLAKYLVERYGYTRLAFADPLKELYEQLAGRPIIKARDRTHIQNLGQLGRAVSGTLWVDKMLKRITDQGIEAGPFVVDDARFPNETHALGLFEGFLIVHVDTPLEDCQARVLSRDGHCDPAWFDNESEQLHTLMSYDATISGIGDTADIAADLLRTLTYAKL